MSGPGEEDVLFLIPPAKYSLKSQTLYINIRRLNAGEKTGLGPWGLKNDIAGSSPGFLFISSIPDWALGKPTWKCQQAQTKKDFSEKY